MGGYITAGFDRVVNENEGREYKVEGVILVVIDLKFLGVPSSLR
jgi:hypothetical protein